jgi:dimethylargininase
MALRRDSWAELIQPCQEQHKANIRALEKCGLRVTVLAEDNDYPDSCFMKSSNCDRPSCCNCRFQAPSRKGEEKKVLPLIEKLYGTKLK